MDNWLEQHIEKHLTFKGSAILVTDKDEYLWHTNKQGDKVPFTVIVDLFDIDPEELKKHQITIL